MNPVPWLEYVVWQQLCLSARQTPREKGNKEGMPAGHQSYDSGLYLEPERDLGLCLAAVGTNWFCDVD